MTKCKACARKFDGNADTCPYCGAEVRKSRTAIVVTSVLMLVVLGVAVYVAITRDSAVDSSAAATPPAPPAALAAGMPQAESSSEALGSNTWVYDSDMDPMTGKEKRSATMVSANKLDFKSPYAGDQDVMLALRDTDDGKHEALLIITEGQFVCDADACPVRVRFDDRPPVMFTGSVPDSDSTTALSLHDAEALLKQLNGTKRIRIEATFFGEGTHEIEFDVSSFDRSRLQ